MIASLSNLLEAGQPLEPVLACQQVADLAEEMLNSLRQPWNIDYALRKARLQALNMANTAIERLERFGFPVQPPADQVEPVQLVVPSELLFQAFQMLFPAERMLVGSGRRMDSQVALGAVFDVTGQANSGHVRADPARLAQALIAMEKSGTFLACWLHSHPGQGAQHQDWLQNYSPHLVSAILIEEGWIRFWGCSLKQGTVTIKILGSGVEKTEAQNEWIYRFCRG
jgi:hypothetical protein